MNIIEIDKYSDGGTIKIKTNIDDYYLDQRLFTKTPNKIYKGYPLDDNSNMIIGCEYNLKWCIWNALRYYQTPNDKYCYKEEIFKSLSV